MGVTPIYAISYPDGTTRVIDLPTALHDEAYSIEAALTAFGMPPVVSSNMVVAASSAARDAHWGTPTTAAGRRTLQNLGAQTVRLDTGWTEGYYAGLTDGGANPGGATVAGWYRIGGKEMGGAVLRSATTNAIAATTWVNLAAAANFTNAGAKPENGIVPFATNGYWIAPVAGRYRIDFSLAYSSAVNMFIAVKKNSTTLDTVGAVLISTAVGTSGFTAHAISGEVTLAAGDILRPFCFSSAAAALAASVGGFNIEFVEPV